MARKNEVDEIEYEEVDASYEEVDETEDEGAVVVATESNLSDSNYSSVELYAANACYQLGNTMDKLLDTPEGEKPKDENIDRAIDCADAMVKMMAMFHKGREIESRREAFNKGTVV